MAMETLRTRLGTRFKLHVDYQRYRRIQVFYLLEACFVSRVASRQELKNLISKLRCDERVVYGFTAVCFGLLVPILHLLPLSWRRRLADAVIQRTRLLRGYHPFGYSQKWNTSHQNALEVFEAYKTTVGDLLPPKMSEASHHG